MFSNKLFLNHPVNDCLELEEKDVFLIVEAAFLSSTEVHLGTGHCSAQIHMLKFPLLSLSAFRNADLFTTVCTLHSIKLGSH